MYIVIKRYGFLVILEIEHVLSAKWVAISLINQQTNKFVMNMLRARRDTLKSRSDANEERVAYNR